MLGGLGPSVRALPPATFTTATVCASFSGFVNNSAVRLLQFDGSAFVDTYAIDGRTLRDLSNDEWFATAKRHGFQSWRGGRLMWHPAGQPYSVWYRFHSDDSFDDYYVNLEVPSVVWEDKRLAGIDTVDWDLDVVASADRRWRFKDVDEFEERLRHRDYWVDDESEVRAAADLAVKLIEGGAFPFDGTWTDFRPEPSWAPATSVPGGWQRPRAVGRPPKRDMDVVG